METTKYQRGVVVSGIEEYTTMKDQFTEDMVRDALPVKFKNLATPDLTEKLNKMMVDPIAGEAFRSNFLTYANVITTGKHSLEEYANAIKYVTYKLFGKSSVDAFCLTFPERAKGILDRNGNNNKHLCSHANAYNGTKLVTNIMEQTLVPSWILNAPLHQEALERLQSIMNNEKERGMTRVKAAEAILNATKQPETKNIKLEMDFNQEAIDGLEALRKANASLAVAQREALALGTSLKSIAEQEIIEGIIEDEDNTR